MTQFENAPRRAARSRRPLVIGIVILAVVVAALATWWGVTAGREAAREKSIRDTVTDFYSAIAVADPEKALSLSTSPVEPGELLTKATLESSLTAAPLTDVEVTTVTTEKPYDRATAAVTYKIGGVDVTDEVPLSKTTDGWRLDRVTSDLTLENVHFLEVNGQKLTQAAQKVLPGTYTAEPVSPNVSLDGDVSVTVLRTGETDAVITPKVGLSKEGVDLVKKTAKKSLDTCLAAKVSNPPNCPWEFSEDGLTVTKNSVSYSLKNDPWENFKPGLVSDDLAATAKIPLKFEATAEVTYKGITGRVGQVFDTDTYLRVDLTSDKPTVIWSKDKFK